MSLTSLPCDQSVVRSLAEGVIGAILTELMVLRSWRYAGALIVILTIPTSIISSRSVPESLRANDQYHDV